MRRRLALVLDRYVEKYLVFFEKVMVPLVCICVPVPIFVPNATFEVMVYTSLPAGILGGGLILAIISIPLICFLDFSVYAKRLKEHPPPPQPTKRYLIKEIVKGLPGVFLIAGIAIGIAIALFFWTGIILNEIQRFSLMMTLATTVPYTGSLVWKGIRRLRNNTRIIKARYFLS